MTKPIAWLEDKGVLALLTVFCAITVTLMCGRWPDVYGFAEPQQGSPLHNLVSAPVRLSDDVMISLRSGYILREIGRPAFNRHDLAQPSTSYLSPYLFSLLLRICPGGTSVPVYAGLGLFAVALTFGCLAFYSRSTVNAGVLLLALLLTTTNRSYTLNGWDHVYQAFFLTLATCIALKGRLSPTKILLVSALLALGTSFRPDGFLISLGVLASVCLRSRKISQAILFAAAPYVLLVGAVLALNFHQFGHLTPTTARLKIGAAPSITYIIKYLIDNGVLSYSALSLFGLLLAFCVMYRRFFPSGQALPIVVSCAATAAIAAYNSDYLPGARMLWSPACVLAAVIAVTAPGWLALDHDHLRRVFSLSPAYKDPSLSSLSKQQVRVPQMLLGMLVLLLVAGAVSSSMLHRAKAAVLSRNSIYASPTAQQYIIARWINERLRPGDGAIGFFFLGVSYDLPRFEIADFLGPADESIATLKVKVGPPGHNKWDLDKTLAKWKPQAIIPAGPVDPNHAETRENSHKHAPDLLSNEKVLKEFAYCYVPDAELEVIDRWGFFLRRDIAALHADELRCS